MAQKISSFERFWKELKRWKVVHVITAVDEYNFRALPGGARLLIEPWWYEPGYSAFFWSSTSNDPLSAVGFSLWYMATNIGYWNSIPKRNGFSVRCLMN